MDSNTKRTTEQKKEKEMSLEMAIADFYAVHELGTIRVLVKSDRECYILGEDHVGKGYAYDREELEYASIATSIFDIEWIEDGE